MHFHYISFLVSSGVLGEMVKYKLSGLILKDQRFYFDLSGYACVSICFHKWRSPCQSATDNRYMWWNKRAHTTCNKT